MKADLNRHRLLAPLAVLLLSGCEPGVEGGYETVAARTMSSGPRYAHPDPPPVTPGTSVGAVAERVVLASPPQGVTQEMVDEGQQLYGGVCVACHGQNGVGSPAGPALNDGDWLHIAGEFEQIVEIINTGVQSPRQFSGIMPPRGGGSYDEAQVRAIAAYVYALSHPGGA